MPSASVRSRFTPSIATAAAPASLREFNLVMGGFAFFQAMACGCRLDLFSWLDRHPGAKLPAIARGLGISSYGARVLLLALAAAALVRRDARGGYRNAPLSSRLLVSDSRHNVIDAVTAYEALVYRPMTDLTLAVRKGTNVGLKVFPGAGDTLYERLASRPREEKIFQRWLRTVSDRSNAALTAGLPTLKKVKHLLDVGGGDGTNAIALHEAYPNLAVTVLDLPSVCRLARANFRRHGKSQQLRVLPGNFLRDPLPRNVDAILFGHILNIFGEATNLELLRRSYEALPPGGMVICFNSMTDDNESGPLRSALLSLYFLTLASGEGMVYPWKDYAAWFKKVGFRQIRVHRVGDVMDHGIVVGSK
jgi:L-tyrosine C(3)-methyltransferase